MFTMPSFRFLLPGHGRAETVLLQIPLKGYLLQHFVKHKLAGAVQIPLYLHSDPLLPLIPFALKICPDSGLLQFQPLPEVNITYQLIIIRLLPHCPS
jgi:hypothetical protein